MNMKGVLNIVMMMLAATLLVLPVSGAFAVTGITPDSGVNTGSVFITNLSGTDLPIDASVTLMLAGQPNITGQFLTWVDPARITCVFDIEEKLAGDWDVVVVNNTDSSEAVLFAGFSIINPAPDVTGITPSTGINNGIITITGLSGSNFLPGAQVNLTNGISTITGTSVNVISGSLIQCQFNINGALPGAWDVVVTNYDGQSATLPGGFSITYPPPSVNSISPPSGKNNEVIGITNLAGSNFMIGATVQLVKENETNITTINGPIVEPTKILCFFDLNAKAVGTWDVVVTNTDGQYSVLPGGFTLFYPQSPTVSGIAPSAGQNDAPITITAITGTGFQPGATVALLKGGETDIPGTVILVSNSTSIGCSFDITGAVTGSWDVKVTNSDGQSSILPAAFTVQNPAPTLNSIEPDNGFNSGPVSVTNLSGTGFLPGVIVALTKTGEPDIPATMVNVITPQMINCSVDLTGAEPGLWSIVVTNPDTQSAVLTDSFAVAYPPPSADAIDPGSGINGQTVPANITGNNFLTGATVTLTKVGEANISAVITGFTASQITCSLNLSGAAAGPWSVVVTNPDGKEGLISNGFEVLNPAPSVTAINPPSGTNDGISMGIELTGTGFLDGATVALKKVGEPDITAMGVPTVVNPTKILCFFNLTDVSVGAWDVVVTNTDLQSGTLPAGFLISYPASPQVISIIPATGVNTGAVAISSLTGTGFEYGAEVLLKKTGEVNITGTNVLVLPPAQITCEFNLAGAAEGPWDIVVINNDGKSGVLAGGFQVTCPPPQIASITPSVGINNGPVSITNLSGVYFRSPATVKLTRLGEPDIPATGVTVVNAGMITCSFALAGAEGGPWNLVVTNPDGQYAIATNIFTVENPAPSISKITPNKGANDSTIFISALNGTGFLPGATVQLTKNGQVPINATGVNVESATKINCTLNLTGKATGKWNVVVKNTDNKTGTLSNSFNITPPPPIPNFTANPVFGTAPLTVQFTDLSTNDPYLWSWYYGDGSFVVGLNQKNPIHTYDKPGVYNVTLLVRNDGGETQLTKKDYISVVITPVASFKAEPVSGAAPLLVKFTDTSDGNPIKWLWKYGDGGYSFDQNPYHLYKNPGLYTVTLTVSNKAGPDTETITNMIEVTSLPLAGFTANRTSGSSPLAVQFKDTSTGSPTSWLWKFCDGGNSTNQNPVYVFENPGTYTVELFVRNDAGNSTEIKEAYIKVEEGLHADFEYATSNPKNTAPLSVAFTDRSSGKVLKWTWRFGDGYISNDRNPIHNYPLPGTYAVTLSVTGLSGSDSMTKTITVKSPLKADFVAEPTTGSAPLTVMLSDISIGTPIERQWVISKDPYNLVILYPGLKEQIYTFNEPGLYKVELNVKDAFGASDSKNITNYINVLPYPHQ